MSTNTLLGLLRASQSAATVAKQQRSISSLVTQQHDLVSELRQELRTADEHKSATSISYNADVEKLSRGLEQEESNLRQLKEERLRLQVTLHMLKSGLQPLTARCRHS